MLAVKKIHLSARVRRRVPSNYLLSLTRFVWLAHTSSRRFTMQLRVPVYIPLTMNWSLHWTQNTYGFACRNCKPRGCTSRKGEVWHISNVFGPTFLAQEVRRSAAHRFILFKIFVKNILLSLIVTHTCGPCGPVAPRSPLSPCRPCILKAVN